MGGAGSDSCGLEMGAGGGGVGWGGEGDRPRGIFERRVKFEIKLISCNRINCGKWECVAAVAILAQAFRTVCSISFRNGFHF